MTPSHSQIALHTLKCRRLAAEIKRRLEEQYGNAAYPPVTRPTATDQDQQSLVDELRKTIKEEGE
jgi:hypothetical protein